MAQFAFVKFDDIESGNTGAPNITFIFKVVWVGDELAGGGYEVRITTSRATTNAALASAVQTAVINQAAALGRPGLTTSDIRLVGGTVF